MADADYNLAPGALRDKPAAGPKPAERSFVLTEHLLAATRPGSIQAESFRALRSNLLSQHVSRGRRALTICSRPSRCSVMSRQVSAWTSSPN